MRKYTGIQCENVRRGKKAPQSIKEKAHKQRRSQRRIHRSNIPKEIGSLKQFKSYGEEPKIEKDSRQETNM